MASFWLRSTCLSGKARNHDERPHRERGSAVGVGRRSRRVLRAEQFNTKGFRPVLPGRKPLVHPVKGGAPGRNRTCDLRFRKPSLYPLSYGGAPHAFAQRTGPVLRVSGRPDRPGSSWSVRDEWCGAAAALLSSHQGIAAGLGRVQHWLGPVVVVGLGVIILLGVL
jgi:hypothetical protein